MLPGLPGWPAPVSADQKQREHPALPVCRNPSGIFCSVEVALEVLEVLHVASAEHTAQLTALGQPDQPVAMLGSPGLHQFILF